MSIAVRRMFRRTAWTLWCWTASWLCAAKPSKTRGPDALEGLFRGFGRTVRTTFAALDPKAVGAEQRGNMLTLAVLSLAHVHRAWFAPLFESLADDARARLEAALTPPARDAARAVAPEQSDADLEQTYARTLFKSFCEELRSEG